jgi:hypothetical protein
LLTLLTFRRWRLWLGVAVLLGGLLVPALWLLPHRRITEADFKRIRDGMTAAEVQVILGRPPDLRMRGSMAVISPINEDDIDARGQFEEHVSLVDTDERLCWSKTTARAFQQEGVGEAGPANTIVVGVNTDGRVVARVFYHENEPLSFTDRLRWRLHAWGW